MSDEGRGPRRWLGGFAGLDWDTDERTYAALLDALTRDRLEVEAVERELSAPLTAAADEQARAERDELAEARREVDSFRQALADVRGRGRDPRTEVPYDSQVPAQDAAADVLIQYLVRPGYAEVRTEERGAEHYIYHIRVDWSKLRALAQEQGHPLPE